MVFGELRVADFNDEPPGSGSSALPARALMVYDMHASSTALHAQLCHP